MPLWQMFHMKQKEILLHMAAKGCLRSVEAFTVLDEHENGDLLLRGEDGKECVLGRIGFPFYCELKERRLLLYFRRFPKHALRTM